MCVCVFPEDQLPPGFPTIDMGPQLKVVERSRTATMLCAASGNPDPEITWFKDFLPVNTSNNNGRIKQLRSGDRRLSLLPPACSPARPTLPTLTCVCTGRFFSPLLFLFRTNKSLRHYFISLPSLVLLLSSCRRGYWLLLSAAPPTPSYEFFCGRPFSLFLFSFAFLPKAFS